MVCFFHAGELTYLRCDVLGANQRFPDEHRPRAGLDDLLDIFSIVNAALADDDLARWNPLRQPLCDRQV